MMSLSKWNYYDNAIINMGCCEVKYEINNTLEVDLNTKHEDSFNDLSISSHHRITSNTFPDKSINPKNESRDRSVSNTYLSTLEQAFTPTSPQITRTSELIRNTLIVTSEETELSVIREENKEERTRN